MGVKEQIEFYQSRNFHWGASPVHGLSDKEVCIQRKNNPKIKLFNAIQIQTIEFCNLKCDFCPNHYIVWDRQEKKKKKIPYNRMSFENYEKLLINLANLGYEGRISPYLMNEPFMDNDRLVRFIEMTRQHLPKAYIQMNSNGTNTTKEFVGDLIDAGLNRIQFDDYFNDKYAMKLYEAIEPFKDNKTCHIILASNYNVRQIPKKESGDGNATMEPHWGPNGYWNRGGLVNVNPDIPVPQKDCHYPNSQMFIKWDGSALLCCCDWEYKVVHGNVFETSVEEVWTNGSYQHYRDTLKQGRRDLLRMCRKCNKGCYPNEEERLKQLKNV